MADSTYQLNISPLDERLEENSADQEEIPCSGVLIRIPDNKTKWNHIEDLDSFFTRMYQYHQRGGFLCMTVKEFFELLRFTFVVCFVTYLFHGINYAILFQDDPTQERHKISLTDALLSVNECIARMGLLTWICVVISIIFWILQLAKFFYNFLQFWDVKSFYNTALEIDDDELDNLTWHDVQRRIREVQKEQEMCIHKKDLTELDIYHRILRFENYMVAMVNKSLLPIHLKFPLIGNFVFLTHGLRYNLEFLLFWGPWSPFKNNWHLQEDYKKVYKRQELAAVLAKNMLWLGLANLILCPVILLWQILFFLFKYGEIIKKEPGILSLRVWSLYGRLYLRHFNELDHELNARLNRAYKPALKYMNTFTSPLVSIVAENTAFVFGSVFLVVFVLSCWDEDVIMVQHFVAVLTISGTVTGVCRALVPDRNVVWCPESLLTAVLAHTHYRPDVWKGKAHTKATRSQVAQLFQYQAVHLLEELASPLLTPYILCFHLPQRALDIVDFYRNFTVEVSGVGDICSFSQMDVKRHGNFLWQMNGPPGVEVDSANLAGHQAEDGKTELSLLHFTITNPEWKPPKNAELFVANLREKAKKEAVQAQNLDNNLLFCSLNSLYSLGPEYNNLVSNIIRTTFNNPGQSSYQCTSQDQQQPGKVRKVSKTVQYGAKSLEGPNDINERGILSSLHEDNEASQYFLTPPSDLAVSNVAPIWQRQSDLTTLDMSLSTLYLHELHHEQMHRHDVQPRNRRRTFYDSSSYRELETLSETNQEQAPLLKFSRQC